MAVVAIVIMSCLAATPSVAGADLVGSESNNTYVGNTAANRSYTKAVATFRVKKGSGGARDTFSMWVGIGGGRSSSDPLVQAGYRSERGSDGKRRTHVFWELFNNPQFHGEQSLATTFGDVTGHLLYVAVRREVGRAFIHITDRTRGTDWHRENLPLPDATTLATEAKFIVERPTVAYKYFGLNCVVRYPLAKFGSVRFTKANVAGPGMPFTPIGKTPHFYSVLVNSASDRTTLAVPLPISKKGDAFSARWVTAGTTQKSNSLCG